MPDPRDLDPIDPGTAQQLYLEHKDTQCAERTVNAHRYRTNHFVRWCEEQEIENLNDLTGRHIHEFRLWRREDGDLNKVSIQTQMSTLRVFLKWAGSIEAVDPDLYNKVMVPQVSGEEERRDEYLDSESAQSILDYLARYHYASRQHVLLALLWQTGLRIGGVNSLDVGDVNLEDRYLDLNHRPTQGTTLKNKSGGERLVAITEELAELLQEYINVTRDKYVDEHGREPLLTTQKGRFSRNTMRTTVYQVTAPCFRGDECPDCRDSTGAKCPEAVSPHAVRRGSITHHLTEDVPVQVVGDRMDVSRKVLDKHYDRRTESVKLEQRRAYLDNI